MSAGQATGQPRSGFRADIQGLRAIAVLLVVAYHARLPVPGGFVGVDVFFVISGFVITAMLLREWHSHSRIRLARFWRRRFFRLTPALALVIAATFVLSALILFPLEQRVAYETGVGALLLIANIVIARNTGGYFDAPAEENPLLNTWSLSVEEQFYLLFPLVLMLALLATRSRIKFSWLPIALVGGVGLLSFAVTLWSLSPSAQGYTWLNFYSPVTRSWEFAVGAVVAMFVAKGFHVHSRIRPILGLLGLAGIAASALVITSTTPFPGPWTLLPVTATALLLVGGTSTNPTSQLLSHRSLVKIGDWSYSIYLWHWPLIVFAIALGFFETWMLVLAALISFLPAIGSYYVVEQPLRRWKPPRTGQRGLAAAGIVGTPIALAVVLTVFLTPQPRFDGSVGTEYLTTIEDTSFPCVLEQVPGSGSRCFQSKEGEPIDIVVVGDSHAEHLYLGIRSTFDSLNTAYVYLPNWPYDTSANTTLTFNQLANDADLDAIIINSRWDEDGASSEELRSTLDLLEGIPAKVFVADDGPTFSFHAEQCQFDRILGPGARCSEGSKSFDQRYDEYLPILEQQVSLSPNAYLLGTADGICRDGVCSMTQGGTLLYADHGHLNELGSQRVIERLSAQDPVFGAIG